MHFILNNQRFSANNIGMYNFCSREVGCYKHIIPSMDWSSFLFFFSISLSFQSTDYRHCLTNQLIHNTIPCIPQYITQLGSGTFYGLVLIQLFQLVYKPSSYSLVLQYLFNTSCTIWLTHLTLSLFLNPNKTPQSRALSNRPNLVAYLWIT